MTREEEIREAIDKIFPCTNGGRCYEQSLGASGFELGVHWADKTHENPWISVKDDLPCNHEELTPKDYTVEVLALDDCDSYIVVRMWKFHDKWVWGLDDLPITHWMRLPELPKE